MLCVDYLQIVVILKHSLVESHPTFVTIQRNDQSFSHNKSINPTTQIIIKPRSCSTFWSKMLLSTFYSVTTYIKLILQILASYLSNILVVKQLHHRSMIILLPGCNRLCYLSIYCNHDDNDRSILCSAKVKVDMYGFHHIR